MRLMPIGKITRHTQDTIEATLKSMTPGGEALICDLKSPPPTMIAEQSKTTTTPATPLTEEPLNRPGSQWSGGDRVLGLFLEGWL